MSLAARGLSQKPGSQLQTISLLNSEKWSGLTQPSVCCSRQRKCHNWLRNYMLMSLIDGGYRCGGHFHGSFDILASNKVRTSPLLSFCTSSSQQSSSLVRNICPLEKALSTRQRKSRNFQGTLLSRSAQLLSSISNVWKALARSRAMDTYGRCCPWYFSQPVTMNKRSLLSLGHGD
jgi:hypothetical protein